MKRLLLALVLTSCAHHQESLDTSILQETNKDSETDIKQLKEDVQQLRYFIDHEKCFISYAICLGEKPYRESKMCWNKHEACVIRVYHQYKDHK